ncbi:hypothetical protein [Streptomyces violaceusniger]|uniref:hypothetical protein n=1 Tax=Streptomyces violaceusniger TaxID=68280 RepID=UPI0001E4C6E1|nr:hypothetical protein [Streptomyces violaceusniger]
MPGCPGHDSDNALTSPDNPRLSGRYSWWPLPRPVAVSAALYEATPGGLRTDLLRLLEVPERRRVSELERLRTGPMRVSGKAMEVALERSREGRSECWGRGRWTRRGCRRPG